MTIAVSRCRRLTPRPKAGAAPFGEAVCLLQWQWVGAWVVRCQKRLCAWLCAQCVCRQCPGFRPPSCERNVHVSPQHRALPSAGRATASEGGWEAVRGCRQGPRPRRFRSCRACRWTSTRSRGRFRSNVLGPASKWAGSSRGSRLHGQARGPARSESGFPPHTFRTRSSGQPSASEPPPSCWAVLGLRSSARRFGQPASCPDRPSASLTGALCCSRRVQVARCRRRTRHPARCIRAVTGGMRSVQCRHKLLPCHESLGYGPVPVPESDVDSTI